MTDLRIAAQQALEALEYDGLLKKRQAITALRAALAQQAEPVQEPVPAAVVGTQSDVWRGYNGQWAPPGEPIKMVQMLRDLPTGTLLYTAPPQRKPLTQEDVDRICASLGFAAISPAEIVRAAERAHGIGETK